jgi:hypothetical protein
MTEQNESQVQGKELKLLVPNKDNEFFDFYYLINMSKESILKFREYSFLDQGSLVKALADDKTEQVPISMIGKIYLPISLRRFNNDDLYPITNMCDVFARVLGRGEEHRIKAEGDYLSLLEWNIRIEDRILMRKEKEIPSKSGSIIGAYRIWKKPAASETLQKKAEKKI